MQCNVESLTELLALSIMPGAWNLHLSVKQLPWQRNASLLYEDVLRDNGRKIQNAVLNSQRRTSLYLWQKALLFRQNREITCIMSQFMQPPEQWRIRRHLVQACTVLFGNTYIIIFRHITSTESPKGNIGKVRNQTKDLFFPNNVPDFDPEPKFHAPVCHSVYHMKTCSDNPLPLNITISRLFSSNTAFLSEGLCVVLFWFFVLFCFFLLLLCHLQWFSFAKPQQTGQLVRSFCGCSRGH